MIFKDWFTIHCVMSHNLFSMAGKIFITFNYLTLETGYHPERRLVCSLESNSSASSQSCQALNFLSFLLSFCFVLLCQGFGRNTLTMIWRRMKVISPCHWHLSFPSIEVKLLVAVIIPWHTNSECSSLLLPQHSEQGCLNKELPTRH